MQNKTIVFLSSKATNLAFSTAQKLPKHSIHLINDRKIPFEDESDILPNFNVHYFDVKNKFQKNSQTYFDMLGIEILQLNPHCIILSNYAKDIPQNCIDFIVFRNPKINIISISHSDFYSNWKNSFTHHNTITSTLHDIISQSPLNISKSTSFDKLKEIGLINSLDEIESLKVKNMLSYTTTNNQK